MIPGDPIETLFLDAGGVLVDPDWTRVAGTLSRHGIAVRPEALAAADGRAKRSIDRPEVILATDDRQRVELYFGAVLQAAGVAAAAPGAFDDLHDEHARSNLWCAILDGVPAALRALRERGLRLVVVSNADGKLAAHFARSPLAGLFDLVVDSGALGVEKPDPRIFAHALRESGADPRTTVHAGDYFEIDVVGARAAGLRSVLVDPSGAQADRDCPRVASLPALAASLIRGERR